jgi:hypothetical protein
MFGFMIIRILFLILIGVPVTVFAQSKWVPSAVRVGVDLYDIVLTTVKSNRTIYEFNADVDFHKYFFSFDYGIFEGSESNVIYDYSSKGYFWRLGLDINLTPYEKSRSVVFFGLRYAEAAFDDKVQFDFNSYYFGNGRVIRENKDLYATWYEMVMGLKVPIWKFVQLGLTGRMKFGRNMKTSNSLESLLVPGYGRGISRTEFAINYHLFFRIPFRNKPIPPKPERKKAAVEAATQSVN